VRSTEQIFATFLPHELMHSVLATHFGGPLPRWADEGISMLAEKEESGALAMHRLRERGRMLSLAELFSADDYPRDWPSLYSQGSSLVEFLVSLEDKKTLVRFLRDGLDDENWPASVREYYGFRSLAHLQDHWLRWLARSEAQEKTPRTARFGQVRSVSPK
jgi:hypothetical protein